MSRNTKFQAEALSRAFLESLANAAIISREAISLVKSSPVLKDKARSFYGKTCGKIGLFDDLSYLTLPLIPLCLFFSVSGKYSRGAISHSK